MSLLEQLNTTREQTIDTHYRAAIAELSEKVKAKPFDTAFTVSSGCPSKVVGEEIARRFTTGGVLTVCTSGVSSYYLTVTLDLPEYLIPKVEAPKIESTTETTEEQKEETQ
jgi:hypothetical protein